MRERLRRFIADFVRGLAATPYGRSMIVDALDDQRECITCERPFDLVHMHAETAHRIEDDLCIAAAKLAQIERHVLVDAGLRGAHENASAAVMRARKLIYRALHPAADVADEGEALQ